MVTTLRPKDASPRVKTLYVRTARGLSGLLSRESQHVFGYSPAAVATRDQRMSIALSMPIVVPEICMGVAMLVFFSRVLPWPYDLPWPLSLGAIIIAHVSFCFPFVTMVVRARLASFNKEQEEAARDLGASDWQAFRDVLLPHMTPALIAGALLSFTLSLDDFVITFFTSGPNTVTFPVKVYSMVRFSVTPEVNAASTMLIVLTVAVMAAMMLAQRPQPKSS